MLRKNQMSIHPILFLFCHPGNWKLKIPGPLQHVVSVVKGKTDLPCDITPPNDDDQASLVLFYKDDASPSIYT